MPRKPKTPSKPTASLNILPVKTYRWYKLTKTVQRKKKWVPTPWAGSRREVNAFKKDGCLPLGECILVCETTRMKAVPKTHKISEL